MKLTFALSKCEQSISAQVVPIAQVLSDLSGTVANAASLKLSLVSGTTQYTGAGVPSNVDLRYKYVSTAHYGKYKVSMPKQPKDKDEVKADVEFAWVLMRYLARMLALGKFTGHPYKVMPGGLAGVEERPK